MKTLKTGDVVIGPSLGTRYEVLDAKSNVLLKGPEGVVECWESVDSLAALGYRKAGK